MRTIDNMIAETYFNSIKVRLELGVQEDQMKFDYISIP